MRIPEKKIINDIFFLSFTSLGVITLIYITAYLACRDIKILKAPPCGGNKPLLAIFKYSNHYESKYLPSLEATKFSYFGKKDLGPFFIFKPLEKIELSYNHFEYYSLTKFQIAEIKKNSDWYRAEFKEMRIYDYFDESKTKD